jgi:hypothetical protein
MFRLIINTALVIALGYFLFVYHVPNICDKPLHYRIGSIDTQFDITPIALSGALNEGSTIWNTVMGRSLFAETPEDTTALTVNMKYDDRQFYTTKITSETVQVMNERSQIQPQRASYEKDVAAFKTKANALNTLIESWNKKGGAPQDVYADLIKQQEALKTEATRLNDVASQLNESTSQYNKQIADVNSNVENFNDLLKYKPEEGLFDPADNSITVYFTQNHTDLVHTLAHELGHSLGMNHNNNENSIMYPKTNESMSPSAEDTADLKKVCAPQTPFERLQHTNWQAVATYYKKLFASFLASTRPISP